MCALEHSPDARLLLPVTIESSTLAKVTLDRLLVRVVTPLSQSDEAASLERCRTLRGLATCCSIVMPYLRLGESGVYGRGGSNEAAAGKESKAVKTEPP